MLADLFVVQEKLANCIEPLEPKNALWQLLFRTPLKGRAVAPVFEVHPLATQLIHPLKWVGDDSIFD